MASAGQAQAHSSQPTHFSRPSGCRLSTCRPWYRGLVTLGTSGYSSVVTLRKICAKVTPKPCPGPGSQLARLTGPASRPRWASSRSVCATMSWPGSWGSGERRSTSLCSVIDVLLDRGGAAPSGAHHGTLGGDRVAAAQPGRRRDGEVHRRGWGTAPPAAGGPPPGGGP